ncbi:MAG TPA: DNA-binding protein [Clostridiaceae bacterium]|nr:DNA-binding protein [Clostridiaceae bacterium]
MEKNVKVSILCQIYGKLLTKKQFEIITDYYDNDLSLSEIAENNQITRQAVRDIIKKSEKKLYELEEELSFMEKQINYEKKINCIIEKIVQIQKEEINLRNKENLEKIKEELKSLV